MSEITWPHVLRRRASYHDWQDERLILRSDVHDADSLVDQALAYVMGPD